MFASYQLRARTTKVFVGVLLVLALLHNAYPHWSWLTFVLDYIWVLILAVAVYGLVRLIITGRRAYRALTSMDKSARQRFDQANHLSHKTPRASEAVVEGEVVMESKAAK